MKNLFALIKQYKVIIIFLLLPIFLYLLKFNNGFSDSVDDWAAFGSYLSGIYAFIAVFTTLYLVSKQIELQREQNSFQESIQREQLYIQERHNLYQIDQDYLRIQTENIEYCLKNIQESLSKNLDKSIFDKLKLEDIKIDSENIILNLKDLKNLSVKKLLKYLRLMNNKDLFNEFKKLNDQFYEILLLDANTSNLYYMWFVLYTCLENVEIYKYSNIHTECYNLKIKIESFLSIDSCMDLDSYHQFMAKFNSKDFIKKYHFYTVEKSDN